MRKRSGFVKVMCVGCTWHIMLAPAAFNAMSCVLPLIMPNLIHWVLERF